MRRSPRTLDSISITTSYREISWNTKAARSVFYMVIFDISQAPLHQCCRDACQSIRAVGLSSLYINLAAPILGEVWRWDVWGDMETATRPLAINYTCIYNETEKLDYFTETKISRLRYFKRSGRLHVLTGMETVHCSSCYFIIMFILWHFRCCAYFIAGCGHCNGCCSII